MPWDLDLLTITEIMVLFAALQEEKPNNLPPSQAVARAQAYHKLSPPEKLELGYLTYR